MAQRLALKSRVREADGERVIFFSDFEEFVRRAKEFGFGPRTQIRVEPDDDGFIFFWVPVPGNQRLPTGKVVKIKKLTKKEIAVKQQIANHKENVKNRVKEPGHIPGVGSKKRKVRIVRKKS